MKIKLLFIGLSLLPLACNLGPLILGGPPTATPTATPFPTLAPPSTETPTVAPTVYLIPTVSPAPTSITCPKGTELNASENRCYYATRTPKPQAIYCPDYGNKAACIKHECKWDASAGECK